MTLAYGQGVTAHALSGDLGALAFNFFVNASSDLRVEIRDSVSDLLIALATPGTDYSIALATPPAVGGVVTPLSAFLFASGRKAVLRRITRPEQQQRLRELQRFPAEEVERGFDLLAAMHQDARRDIGGLQEEVDALAGGVIADLTPEAVAAAIILQLANGQFGSWAGAADGEGPDFMLPGVAIPGVAWLDVIVDGSLQSKGGWAYTIENVEAGCRVTLAETPPLGAMIAIDIAGLQGIKGDPGASYTDEDARDAIGAALVSGTGIDITVNDGADTITISATGGGGASDAADVDFDPAGLVILTATNVQDALEQLDAAIDALPGGGGGDYTDEDARDAIGAALVAGSGINIAVNDGADTITISATGGGGGRELLTANRTYYVRSDGSDSNDGLANSSGGAFLTIQKALNVCATIDFGGYTVTVQLGDATYTAALTVPVTVGQALTGSLILKGNTSTPGNTIISTTSANCITAGPGARIHVQDLELRTTTSGNCLQAVGGAITFANLRFGACAARHMRVEASGLIEATGGYDRVGNCTHHASATSGGLINVVGRAVTAVGTPAHSTAYAAADTNGTIRMFSNTYSGASTGPRHSAATGGGIQTAGAGVNNLPGNSNGTTTAPGWDA